MEDFTSTSSINVLELLQSEMDVDDSKIQLAAIRKIIPIAIALGEEATRTQLLPYLSTFPDKLYMNDEILMNIGDQLGDFLSLVGGEEHIATVFDVLIKLAATEECLVRKSAIDSMRIIIADISPECFASQFMPFFERMKNDDWFTMKCSLLDLIPHCYEKVPEECKAELRDCVSAACNEDESPLVRHSAAKCLVNLVEIIDMEYMEPLIIPLFLKISEDPQDTIRLLAVNIAVNMCRRMSLKQIEESIMLVLERLEADESWRIRAHMAGQILTIQDAIGPQLTRKTLVHILVNLSKDVEDTVRKAIATNMVPFCASLQATVTASELDSSELDPIIIPELLTVIMKLAEDSNLDVEMAIATHFSALCRFLGPERSRDYILPIITNTVTIALSNVRVEHVANLNTCLQVIGVESITGPLEFILAKLAGNRDCNWRCRRELLATLFQVSLQTDSEYFGTHMAPVYVKLLRDSVFSIRRIAPVLLPVLLRQYGRAWFEQYLLGKTLRPARRHCNYLYRMSCLFAIDELVTPTLEENHLSRIFSELEAGLSVSSDINKREASGHLLTRILILSGKFSEMLDLYWVDEVMVDIYTGEEYFGEQLSFYAEDVLVHLTQQLSEEAKTAKSTVSLSEDKCYLDAILILLIKYLVPTVGHLAGSDPIENVRIRAARSLQQLLSFRNYIREELAAPWIVEFSSEIDGVVTETEKDNIKNKIMAILEEDVGAIMESTDSDDEDENRSEAIGTLRKSEINTTIASLNNDELFENQQLDNHFINDICMPTNEIEQVVSVTENVVETAIVNDSNDDSVNV